MQNNDNVSVSASLGIRLDEYDPNRYPQSPAKYGGELPEPWTIAIDILTNINALSENVSIFSRSSYIDATKPADFDVTASGERGDDYINERSTVWVEVGSDHFPEPPDWATGSTSALYHIGSNTYDTREFGGEDSTISIEETATSIVERAVDDLIPSQVWSQDRQDRPLIQVRLPSSLVSGIENYHGWKEWMFRNTHIQILKENGLGFRTLEDVYGYYEPL